MASNFKVEELRAELAKRGLDTTGTKPTLVRRLEEAIQEESKRQSTSSNANNPTVPIELVDDAHDGSDNGKLPDVVEEEKLVTLTKEGAAALDEWLPDDIEMSYSANIYTTDDENKLFKKLLHDNAKGLVTVSTRESFELQFWKDLVKEYNIRAQAQGLQERQWQDMIRALRTFEETFNHQLERENIDPILGDIFLPCQKCRDKIPIPSMSLLLEKTSSEIPYEAPPVFDGYQCNNSEGRGSSSMSSFSVNMMPPAPYTTSSCVHILNEMLETQAISMDNYLAAYKKFSTAELREGFIELPPQMRLAWVLKLID